MKAIWAALSALPALLTLFVKWWEGRYERERVSILLEIKELRAKRRELQDHRSEVLFSPAAATRAGIDALNELSKQIDTINTRLRNLEERASALGA